MSAQKQNKTAMSAVMGNYRVSFFAQGVIAAYREDIRKACNAVWPFGSWSSGISKEGVGDFEGVTLPVGDRATYYMIAKGNRMATPGEAKGLHERIATAIYTANRWHYCRIWFSLALVVEDCVYEEKDFERLRAKAGSK